MLARHSCQTCRVSQTRARLQRASLYLVCGDQPDRFLERALRGGVDIVQLRIKQDSADVQILSTARRYKQLCLAAGALLIVNDRPDMAVAADADGVHIGQDDVVVEEARAVVGAERLVGLSTHTRAQVDAAGRAGVDYIGVGPVYATPTKPGRPAVGLELVGYAARRSAVPFFAIGGIDSTNVAAVGVVGARRIAVVRALTEAEDPELAARVLHAGLTGATSPDPQAEVSVGGA
jgi:thiamine-phosphate pyrophosphorylase